MSRLQRGNVTGSMRKNIEHLQEQLKNGRNMHKKAIKHGVIKVAVQLEESVIMSTREAASLYIAERNSLLNIKEDNSSYRAIDTYQLLCNYLNVAQLYIFGFAYLVDAHNRDLNQISHGIFSLISRVQTKINTEKALETLVSSYQIVQKLLTLREKPNIWARIRSNRDGRTPRILQCSDIFNYGCLEYTWNILLKSGLFFCIQIEHSKCSIYHTGHVLVD